MSTTSKYKLVEQDLFAKIQSGELKVGQKIQTEAELCKHYGVSRMTVRKALDFLASQGIIRRIAGKGTFVSSLHIQTTQRMQGFSDGIASAGMTRLRPLRRGYSLMRTSLTSAAPLALRARSCTPALTTAPCTRPSRTVPSATERVIRRIPSAVNTASSWRGCMTAS